MTKVLQEKASHHTVSRLFEQHQQQHAGINLYSEETILLRTFIIPVLISGKKWEKET